MDNTDYIQKRSFLMANVENILENLSSRRESKKNDSDNLFGDLDEDTSSKINFKTEYRTLSKFETLMMEKEALGLYVSGNPVNEFENLLEFCRNVADEPTLFIVLIEKIKKVFTKAGQMMLVMSITIPHESIEGVIFSKKAMELSTVVQEKQLFWVKGKIQEPKNKKEEVVEDGDNGAVEEIKEFVELTKLIFDTAVPFEAGIVSLLNKAELPLSNTRKDIFAKLNWSELLINPSKLDEMVKAQDTPQSSSKPKPLPNLTENKKIKISSNLGLEKAKEIKSKLSKVMIPDSFKVSIEIEHQGKLKVVDGDFWIDKTYFNSIKNLM